MKNITFSSLILLSTCLLYFTLRSNTVPHDAKATSATINSFSDSGAFRVLNFDIKCQTKARQISWSVQDENFIDRYELQRSFSSTWAFNTITTITPQALKTASYLYTDLDAATGSKVYYRLALVGKDGYARFSNIIEGKTDRIMTVTAYPNPSIDHIKLNFPDLIRRGGIRIANAQGHTVIALQNFSGTNYYQDMSKFSDGIYYVEVISENGVAKTSFIKKARR